MIQFKKILVPFDDNERSIKALEYAAMFASGIGAKITALHVADAKDYRSKKEFQASLKSLVDLKLRPALNRIQKRFAEIVKIDLQVRGMDKPLHQHIVSFAKENDIDFLIMRSHGKALEEDWESVLKTTTAYKVVLDAPCPVFTFTQVPESPQLNHLMVPIDLSEGSVFKIPLVMAIARQFNATIHLVSAVEDETEQAELKPTMDALGDQLTREGVKVVRGNVLSDSPHHALLSYAKDNKIDLVVIMSRPGFRWSDLWVSPKAKQIINLSRVPVLSVRSNQPVEIGL